MAGLKSSPRFTGFVQTFVQTFVQGVRADVSAGTSVVRWAELRSTIVADQAMFAALSTRCGWETP